MTNMALEKAMQSFESPTFTPEDIHNKLSDVVRSMNACSSCLGHFYLTDDNEIKTNDYYNPVKCAKHDLQRYNIEHNVTNKKEFISESMIMNSIFWMFCLPATIAALIGKYTGNLLYQKNLVKRVDTIKSSENTEKYLTEANLELEAFIKRVDQKGLTTGK